MRKSAAQAFACSLMVCSLKVVPEMSARLGFMIFVRKIFLKTKPATELNSPAN